MMGASISKTRERLIDVARQLFARYGVDNTTMHDIAQESEKGRRTLYTYFKSKKEIYDAVIETELNKLVSDLDAVVRMNLPADKKLIKFIEVRLKSVKDVVFRNGTLRADFFRDIWRVENVRKHFDIQEIRCIEKILTDGKNSGLFVMEDTRVTAEVLHYALKGLEVPYIRGIIANDRNEEKVKNMLDILLHGLINKN